MNVKKLTSFALALVLIFSTFSLSAFAAPADTYGLIGGISLHYDIAIDPYCSLDITGTTAECYSETSTMSAVKITAEQILQKKVLGVWINVPDAKWTTTVNSDYIDVTNTMDDLESGKYRLKTVFTLTNENGKKETVKIYSLEKSVS